MSDPRFRPQDLSTESGKFGKVLDLPWRSASSIAADFEAKGMLAYEVDALVASRLGAARLQNLYSFRIRKELKSRNRSLKQYAAQAGVSYDRMAKVIRGDAVMRLEDIAAADHLLAPISELARSEAVARILAKEAGAKARQLRDQADARARREKLDKELNTSSSRLLLGPSG